MKTFGSLLKLGLCVALVALPAVAHAETCIGDAVSCTKDPHTGKVVCTTVVGPPCTQCDVSEVGSQTDTGFSILAGLGLIGFVFTRRSRR